MERAQQELELVKSERDRKIAEYQQRLEKERDMFNTRKRDVESKARETEGRQTELLLGFEKERAKWDQQMTDLVHQREDFKSESDRLKMKVDS